MFIKLCYVNYPGQGSDAAGAEGQLSLLILLLLVLGVEARVQCIKLLQLVKDGPDHSWRNKMFCVNTIWQEIR